MRIRVVSRGIINVRLWMTTATAALAALYFQFFFFQMIHELMSIESWASLAQAAQAQAGSAGPNLTRRNNIVKTSTTEEGGEEQVEERCAINIYGLPRAFKSIVLPSMIQNVIQPNAAYQCDYFIHYYNLTTEVAGRSGQGGNVNAQEILLLKEHVLYEHAKLQQRAKMNNDGSRNNRPSTKSSVVIYEVSQEQDFWKQYSHLINKIHSTKDANNTGNYLYFPWKAKTYTFPTTVDNIIKMWHSIQSVWNLMEQHAATAASIKYTRVAMLRSDVFYLTPIDIWAESSNDDGSMHHIRRTNVKNDQVVIPGFGRHPVSDRLIYGPYDAVKPWAKMRFRSLEQHVSYMQQHNPGWAMHSERFVHSILLPRIRKLGYQVAEHDSMCFFRARVDESVWITDCSSSSVNVSKVTSTLPMDIQGAVERILDRACTGGVVNVTRTFRALQCPSSSQQRGGVYYNDYNNNGGGKTATTTTTTM